MLHPDVARALATARLEDLHRAAARRREIRCARPVANEPHVGLPQADGMTPTEIPQARGTRSSVT
jgi:hypothetical protein